MIITEPSLNKSCICHCFCSASPSFKKIDWVGAEKSGDLALFSAEMKDRLEPLYSRVCDDVEVISSEIEQD